MTHLPELLMNVVTAVPLKQHPQGVCGLIAGSEGFTGISEQDPVRL